jgi:hypothetical protein
MIDPFCHHHLHLLHPLIFCYFSRNSIRIRRKFLQALGLETSGQQKYFPEARVRQKCAFVTAVGVAVGAKEVTANAARPWPGQCRREDYED